ncbi:MAG TPA: nucleoside triphosphate pyrophosphatase [Longimicrobiales bacterium]|nr:nucleoside triphosphate pyrophosphatase [Longimicrobiales bacterium]
MLASGSPRRTELLTRWGLEHEVDPARVPEVVHAGEGPFSHVKRLARDKARAVAARHPGRLVLAGDTEVVLDGRTLGKPRDPEGARKMLRELSGRTHRVITGLALAGPGPGELRSRCDVAQVTFRQLSEADIVDYVATGEPMDKAGGYGIQGLGGALVTRVEGDYYTVVGLPVSGLVDLLEEAGWRYAFGALVPR